ncbi:uncharacterized protein K452DRAFT_292746 [Aplosporella prunicola CBS 121167]|uniref:SnoaL-like domain-containing protein n=1 Tax=Aplosporella prunicola CBS 121167 TaxID=1176127 RepID=A0A6A6AYI0_9PEZI|nr:uncharacterized protein K452DRAFT_292746 [Aplosporella prunicola CBS 121167]KAF2136025.1 hypothetical protein K452DRAFT_292746 [Aplosporella prunicola CBS 121167]
MAPSILYTKLHTLAQAHATPRSLDHILSIRAPNAVHAWGHNYLVSRNARLQERMDNAAFKAHLLSTGKYISASRSVVHSITVDEHARSATVHMSYFLSPKGSEETVENDLVWLLRFTDEEEVPGGVDGVLIKESVEFVDAAASARLGGWIREVHGELSEDVRGGITLKEGKL